MSLEFICAEMQMNILLEISCFIESFIVTVAMTSTFSDSGFALVCFYFVLVSPVFPCHCFLLSSFCVSASVPLSLCRYQ